MKLITLLILTFYTLSYISAQVIIGESDPDRDLIVTGTGTQTAQVRTMSGGSPGLELARGTMDDPFIDWQIVNQEGVLRFKSGNFKLFNSTYERMRISQSKYIGLGTTQTNTKLQVDGGEALNLTQDGLLMMGYETGLNLAFDENKIQARNDEATTTMYVQSYGGDTYFNATGGNTLMGANGSRLGIGTTSPVSPVHLRGDDWHMFLSNNGGNSPQNWYIGATGDSWSAGDDQLVFSPTSSSDDAILRLRNTSDNNGNIAPVSITSNGQELLIDGNEIDSKVGALYFNYNSDENTLFNLGGGKLVTGGTTPVSLLTIYTEDGEDALSFQNGSNRWDLSISPIAPAAPGSVHFHINDDFIAYSWGYNGNWYTTSDSRAKSNIEPLGGTLHNILQTPVYTYQYKKDKEQDTYYGVLAQELAKSLPQAVKITEDKMAVAYSTIAVAALKAIQEQQLLIEDLENKIALLEKE